MKHEKVQSQSGLKSFALIVIAVIIGCLGCLGFFELGISKSYAADRLDKGIKDVMSNRYTGDFSTFKEKRIIRILIPYSKTFYFLDGATERGATYEAIKEFEKFVNKELKTSHLKLHVFFIPTHRDNLITGLLNGLGDIATGNLTITDRRLAQIDFTDPLAKGVDEIVVTGPGSEPVKTLADLSGKTVYVRKSSSYFENLSWLNRKFRKEGKEPIEIEPASEYLEDEDLLEMVNAGLMPITVVDNFKARLWAKVFPDIVLHNDVKVNTEGAIAWAIRKDSPEFAKILNKFIKTHKKGTLFGNVIFNRYYKDTKFVKNNLSMEDRKRYQRTIELFKKYGARYRFDWLMLTALAYQESALDQSKRSKAGAIGVMQILPSTASDKNIGIENIEKIEPNIHAGTKYIRFMIDQYFNDPQIDEVNRGLFAFASYNAGPSRIVKLRAEAAKEGLDPNIWFSNVEAIAAKRIGRETVQYVSNILKYYTAYKLMERQSSLKSIIKEVHRN